MQAVMEEISGGRMHYMFNRVGGLKEDLPAGWLGRVRAAVAAVRRRLPDIENLIFGNEIFQRPHPGRRRARPARRSRSTGVSGPIARASGVDFDLRRDEPYLAYGELAASGWSPGPRRATATPVSRCCSTRCKVSLDLADACLDRLAALPAGPDQLRLPKILKVPEGHTYAWTENPLGHQRLLPGVAGREDTLAAQAASASFNNISGAADDAPGHLVADMVAILGSMFFVVGDIDK